jgi:hypothetical protein
MDEVVEGAKLGGMFAIGGGRSVLGELTIGRTDTALYLHDDEFFHLADDAADCLHGVLHDRTLVTVLGSSVRSELGSTSRYDRRFHFAELSPAYVITGSRHLSANVPEVAKVTFHIGDAEDVFYDFDAMGHVIDPRPLIKAVVAANERRIGRAIPTGPAADIAYFAGRTELVDVATAVGRVRIYHQPIPSHPLATREVGMRNRTLVELSFDEPRLLEDALDAVLSLLRFLELMAGRPQDIDGIWIGTVGEERTPPLDLYWTYRPRRPTVWEERAPHPAEILIRIVDEPDRFAAVLTDWLAVDAARRDARVRFSNGFAQQRSFPIDRMVAAANMFDILPDDTFPGVGKLADEVADAKATAKRIFRALPDSPERESMLNALGRLGKATLRGKVRHRAALVSGALRAPLPELDLVTDEAVRCRNHYVHGSPGSFDYAQHGGVFTFLTGALEFLFAASDLVEAGWDIAKWRGRGGVLAHPFSRVLHEWDQQAALVRQLREHARGTAAN